jgi:LemA protein
MKKVIAGTENRIAVERRRYNESVQAYNIKLRSFPENLIAGMFGFQKQTFFEAPRAAKEAPKVNF